MSPEPLTRSESRSTLQRISPDPATEALPDFALKLLASMSPEPAMEKSTESVLPLIFTSPEPFMSMEHILVLTVPQSTSADRDICTMKIYDSTPSISTPHRQNPL